jgi:hypothetical protein
MRRYTKLYSALTALVFLFSHSNIALAAEDFLLRVDTNQGTSYGSSQAVPNIAKLKQMRFRIPTSNPDNVTVQVVLANPLENPNSILDSKWNFGTWIYGPSLYCLNNNTCSFILIVRPNYNQKAQVRILKTAEDKEVIYSDCPATYSVGKNENNDSVISYNLSITCLNIKATFASYTFSGYDFGFTDIPYQYTTPSYVINSDYYELAKQSYDKNGGKQGLSKSLPSTEGDKEICVTGTDGKDYSDEQCTTGNTWAFQFCDLAPKSDLQILRNKKWTKLSTIRGVRDLDECPDDDKYSGYYFYKTKGALISKHRVKTYGNKKYATKYINLEVVRSTSTY